MAACYSNSLMQEPNPLPPGNIRLGLGLQSFPGRGGGITPELAARVGLTDHMEARAKGTAFGADVGINAELYEDDRYRVVVMPMGKFYSDVADDTDSILDEYAPAPRNIRAASLPVIGSVRAGWAEFFAGPDAHAGRRGSDPFLAVGGHLGVALRAGPRVHFVPECSLLWGAAGARPGSETTHGEPYHFLACGNVSAQCGLGMSFGARDDRRDD